jgi:hypothetical protein
MKIREPIPHWNNFTVSELKEILEHCQALDRIGISQDEEMMASIKRDITLREKKVILPNTRSNLERSKSNQQKENQKHLKINKREQPKEQFLEQNV